MTSTDTDAPAAQRRPTHPAAPGGRRGAGVVRRLPLRPGDPRAARQARRAGRPGHGLPHPAAAGRRRRGRRAAHRGRRGDLPPLLRHPSPPPGLPRLRRHRRGRGAGRRALDAGDRRRARVRRRQPHAGDLRDLPGLRADASASSSTVRPPEPDEQDRADQQVQARRARLQTARWSRPTDRSARATRTPAAPRAARSTGAVAVRPLEQLQQQPCREADAEAGERHTPAASTRTVPAPRCDREVDAGAGPLSSPRRRSRRTWLPSTVNQRRRRTRHSCGGHVVIRDGTSVVEVMTSPSLAVAARSGGSAALATVGSTDRLPPATTFGRVPVRSARLACRGER